MRKNKVNKLSNPQVSLKKISDVRYQKSVFPDGIRVITERIPHVRSVSIGFWIQVGTRDENLEVNGISHFIEHLLFKGTNRRTAAEIAQSLENVGGHLNAFTSKELTCYYAHVLDNDLPIAVDVLADMLTDSIFDPDEIAKEKEVILEEINSVDDVPEERVHDYFYQDLFENHPLGLTTLGTKESIQYLTREMALQYMKDYYSRDRLIVAACGNLQHEAVCQLLEDRFLCWDAQSPRHLSRPRKIPGKIHPRQEDVLQTHICLGSQTFPFSDERKYAALVMNTLLGAGMGSRLFQSIREKYGLCYNIYSYLEFLHDTGVFCIYTATDKQKADLSLELIHKELKNLQDATIAEDELYRTKSQLKGNLMLSLESTASRMNRLAKMEVYLQDYYSLDDVVKGIEAVSIQDVLEVSRSILEPEKLTTTIIKPKM